MFEFETKRHSLSTAKSKTVQYMNTNILIHWGLSLTITLVKTWKELLLQQDVPSRARESVAMA
eukprot:14192204-Ditylum_brightwellii.AAC.1